MAEARVVAVGHVTLRTKDVARAVEFYRKVVGLKHVVKSDFFNAFEVGDVHFCVMRGKPAKNVHFDFTTDDVDRLFERLSKAGVACTKPANDRMSGHRWFTFIDPDGHNITVLSAHHPMPGVES